MKQEEINGFTKDEVKDLYRFICMYEKGGFGFFYALEDVYRCHPQLVHILPLFLGNLELSKTGLREIQKVDLSTFKNKICFTKSKNKDKVLSFLSHLRNSIAHGLIFREELYRFVLTVFSIAIFIQNKLK